MPNFQASLRNAQNVDDVLLDSTATILIVTEHSNTATSDEDGNELADFDLFRKMIATDPNGNMKLYSSIGDGDFVITTGDAGLLVVNYTMTAADGVYTFRLITIPTWDAAVDYSVDNNHTVVKDVGGTVKIYKCIVASSVNEAPDVTPASWTEITDVTLVNAKYNVLGYGVVYLNLQRTKILAEDAAAAEGIREIDTNFLNNVNLNKAARLDMIIKSIVNNGNRGRWDYVKWLVAEGTKIC